MGKAVAQHSLARLWCRVLHGLHLAWSFQDGACRRLADTYGFWSRQLNHGRKTHGLYLWFSPILGYRWRQDFSIQKTSHRVSGSLMPKPMFQEEKALKFTSLFLFGSVLFFVFDIVSDLYERLIARNAPSFLDLVHLTFEVASAAALILAIRVLLRQLRLMQERNIAQTESLRLLRGEMDHFVRNKFTHWGLSPAERDIAMYMLKGLSISEIATARATAEGTIKAQSSSIFRKTGVNSRTELMSLFMDEFLDVAPESNL